MFRPMAGLLKMCRSLASLTEVTEGHLSGIRCFNHWEFVNWPRLQTKYAEIESFQYSSQFFPPVWRLTHMRSGYFSASCSASWLAAPPQLRLAHRPSHAAAAILEAALAEDSQWCFHLLFLRNSTTNSDCQAPCSDSEDSGKMLAQLMKDFTPKVCLFLPYFFVSVSKFLSQDVNHNQHTTLKM